jgi:hypothetical protein
MIYMKQNPSMFAMGIWRCVDDLQHNACSGTTVPSSKHVTGSHRVFGPLLLLQLRIDQNNAECCFRALKLLWHQQPKHMEQPYHLFSPACSPSMLTLSLSLAHDLVAVNNNCSMLANLDSILTVERAC